MMGSRLQKSGNSKSSGPSRKTSKRINRSLASAALVVSATLTTATHAVVAPLVVDTANANSPYTVVAATPGFTTITVGNSSTGVINDAIATTATSTVTVGNNLNSNGTFNLSAGSLTDSDTSGAGILYVGQAGTGYFNQSGTSTVSAATDVVFVGNASSGVGTYTLSGTTASLTSASLDIGNSGIGYFNQSGTTKVAVGTAGVYLGVTSSGIGTYNLGGTTANLSGGSLYVGYSGTGTFNQSGTTSVVNVGSNPIVLGDAANSVGTYLMTAGTLQQTATGGLSMYVGLAGAGTFNQTGGAVNLTNTDTIYVGNSSTGTYLMSGTATLTSSTIYVGGNGGGTGTFNMTGGTINLATHSLDIAAGAGSTGTFLMSGASTVNLLSMYVGFGSTGFANVSGGTINATGSISVGYNGDGTLNMSGGTTVIKTTINLYDGYNYAGVINLMGGTFNVSGNADVSHFTGNGLLNVSGGTLNTVATTSQFNVGDASFGALLLGAGGTINLAGTTPAAVGLTGGGAMTMSGGTFNASTGGVIVGENSTGVVNQTGGNFNAGSPGLTLGTASTGTYNLSGGNLLTTSVTGAAGSTLNLNGGNLILFGATGTIGGAFTANVQTGGAIFNAAGGALTISQPLLHDTTSNAPALDGGVSFVGTGTYTLTGGSTYTGGTNINAGQVILGATNALPTATTVQLGSGTASGVLSLNGVNQTLAGLVVSGSGIANNVSGGSATLSTLTIAPSTATTNAFAGHIGGAGANQNNLALAVNTPGTVALSGSNTYTGGTTLTAGTLQANGLASFGTGPTAINGGVLAGTGITGGGLVTLNSAGTITGGTGTSGTVGNLNVSGSGLAINGGTYNVKLNGSVATIATAGSGASGGADELLLGSLSVTAGASATAWTITPNLSNSGSLGVGKNYSFTIADDLTSTTEFSTLLGNNQIALNTSGLSGTYSLAVKPDGSSGQDLILNLLTTPPVHNIISLTTTAPAINYGSQLTSATATFNPNSNPNEITVTRAGPYPGGYLPGYAHVTAASGTATNYVEATGFVAMDLQLYALKLLVGSGAPTAAEINQIITDINAESGTDGVTASTIPAADASFFPGYSILLTETGTPNSTTDYLGFDFSQETNVAGVTVTDVAAVPEPASIALIVIPLAGALLRRRRVANN